MSVGVNIAPGWSDTVYGRNLPQMNGCLDDLHPDAIRMPWVNNAATIDTWARCASAGIDVILEDDKNHPPEQVVSEIAAVGLPCFVEGVNEPDGTPVRLTAAQLTAIVDRQARLYAAVADRWPVLSSAGVNTNGFTANEGDLIAMACDIANVHRYPDLYGAPPAPDRAVLPVTDKPVWVTEFGLGTQHKKKWIIKPIWYVDGGQQVTEAQQRDYLTTFAAMLRANGAARVCVYCLEDTGSDIFNPSANMGLYRGDGTAKLAAGAPAG